MTRGPVRLAKAAPTRDTAGKESMMANTARSKERDTREPDPQLLRERGEISAEGKKWLEENAEAIESFNRWVDQHELPLAKYRLF